jgi:hypothetical protein
MKASHTGISLHDSSTTFHLSLLLDQLLDIILNFLFDFLDILLKPSLSVGI